MKETESLNSNDEYNGQTLKTLELKSRKYYCKSCGKESETDKENTEHFRQFHERNSCLTCDYVSFGSSDMKLHQKKHVATSV